MSRGAGGPGVIEVVSVRDLGDRVEAVVRVNDPRFSRTRTFPALVKEVLASHPGLRRHRCECGVPHGIEAELADTETVHLIEHLALELMVAGGAPRTLRGETRWDFARDGRGVFRVTLRCADEDAGFADSALATRSLREATTTVDGLLQAFDRRGGAV